MMVRILNSDDENDGAGIDGDQEEHIDDSEVNSVDNEGNVMVRVVMVIMMMIMRIM